MPDSIVRLDAPYPAVDVPDRPYIHGVPKCRDAFGEAPAYQIIPEKVHHPPMEAVWNRSAAADHALHLGQEAVLDPVGPEELLEVHRMQALGPDALGICDAERGPGRHDPVPAAFGKLGKQRQEAFAEMDVVQEDEGVVEASEVSGSGRLDGIAEVLGRAYPAEVRFRQGDLHEMREQLLPQTADQGCLACLPGADEDEGPVVVALEAVSEDSLHLATVELRHRLDIVSFV